MLGWLVVCLLCCLLGWSLACLVAWLLLGCLLNSPRGPIGEWDVSNVVDMTGDFRGAAMFDGDVSKWDVTSMSAMFTAASFFNGDLSKWDVSSITSMSARFAGAASFNSDLSEWDVSSMTSMFHSATSLGLGLVVFIHMNYFALIIKIILLI